MGEQSHRAFWGDQGRLHRGCGPPAKVTKVLTCVLRVGFILLMVGATEMFLSEARW